MIDIQIGNSFLELDKASIRIEKVNPSFISDIFQGDYSFPFTINDTENNRIILGYSNIIELETRTVIYDSTIWLFGVPYPKAKLFIQKVTKNKIYVNIAGGLKAFVTSDINLRDLNFGSDYYLGQNSAEIVSKVKTIANSTNYLDYGFTFVPHKNPNFYGEQNLDFCGVLNRQNPVTGDFFYNTVFTGNKYALVPFLYLFFLLDKIFEKEGLTPSGSFYEDSEMQKILLYNNYALDSAGDENDTYVLANVDKSYLTDGVKVQFFKGISGTIDPSNNWNNNTYEYTILQPGDITIDILLNYFIDFRENNYSTNYQPTLRLYKDTSYVHSIILPQGYGNKSLTYTYNFTAAPGDVGKKIYLKNIVSYGIGDLTGVVFNILKTSSILFTTAAPVLNIFSKQVKFKNHVNDMTCGDLLHEIKRLGVNIEPDFDLKTVKLDYDKNIRKSSVFEDWTSKVEDDFELSFDEKNKGFRVKYDFGSGDELVKDNFKTYNSSKLKGSVLIYEDLPAPSNLGDIYLVENLSKLFIVTQNSTEYEWKYYSDFYYENKFGNGETEVVVKLAPIFMDKAENEGGTTDENICLVPSILQQGSSDMFGIGTTDFDLRVMFLRGKNKRSGFINSNRGGIYNYAGTSLYGLNGNRVGKYSFSLTNERGILPTFIYEFLEYFSKGEFMEIQVRLNELDILNLNVKTRKVIDGIAYLVKSVSIPVSDKLNICKAILLKLIK